MREFAPQVKPPETDDMEMDVDNDYDSDVAVPETQDSIVLNDKITQSTESLKKNKSSKTGGLKGKKKKGPKVKGKAPDTLVTSDGKLTKNAIQILHAITGVGIATLKAVKIKSNRDNRFWAPWYPPNKGGGALTVGNTIYFTQNFFTKSGYGKAGSDPNYGKNDYISTMNWLSLLSHEVGHLPQAESFGTNTSGIVSYLGYFVWGYASRFLNFQFPVHDGFAPEITAELGHYIFDKVFVTTSSSGSKSLNPDAVKLYDMLVKKNDKGIKALLDSKKTDIDKYTAEYVMDNLSAFQEMQKRLEKAQKWRDRRAKIGL